MGASYSSELRFSDATKQEEDIREFIQKKCKLDDTSKGDSVSVLDHERQRPSLQINRTLFVENLVGA